MRRDREKPDAGRGTARLALRELGFGDGLSRKALPSQTGNRGILQSHALPYRYAVYLELTVPASRDEDAVVIQLQ